MATATKPEQIDELIDTAREALERSSFFQAERICVKALEAAHLATDYERMIQVIGSLKQAREGRIKPALAVKKVTIVTQTVAEDFKVRTACYLIEPPQVGADGRRLHLAALAAEVPAAVLCREPRTMLGLWPVVAISPAGTVRTKVDAPPDETANVDWFINTMEAMGEFALESIDPQIDPVKRVGVLLNRLDALPDHQGLHRALEDACRGAIEAPAAKSTSSRRA
jgi:hypothetical protein